ncbi:hypothetical protein HDU96_008144 [Phlyctochytrium bullatum]|nr:hypothetical protein HDU96_008144 [Phlyctochytrium bullatum]
MASQEPMLAIKVVGPGPDRVTRRFSVPAQAGSTTWADMERSIRTLHSIAPSATVVVTYLDEDNEEICIDSDAELADLIASAARRNQTSIRFTVNLKEAMGNASDPRESFNSVATYRTQASQNLSSILPPPPSPKSFDREGWQVLDDGTPSHSAAAHTSSSSSSYGRNVHIHSGSSDERPSSQAFDSYRDSGSDGAGGPTTHSFSSIHSQAINPLDDSAAFERVPPLFPPLNAEASPSSNPPPSYAADMKARQDVEQRLLAVIAENEARLQEMKKNPNYAPGSAAAAAPASSAAGLGGLPEDVRKFLDQVRGVVANYPEALRQLNIIVDQQIARNVNANLEYAIMQIQASIARVHAQSVDLAGSANDTVDKFSKAAREAAYKARIEAYDASRRAYEEARSAARMAREAFKSARSGRGGGMAASSSSSPPSTAAKVPPPSAVAVQDEVAYAERARMAAEAGFGLGVPPAKAAAAAAVASQNAYAKQLAKLTDMGFTDEGLNMDLLSQNDGEVEKVVELLMELQV